MRNALIILFIFTVKLCYTQTWPTAGTNVVRDGSNLRRDGNLSSNHLNSITSPTIILLGDTLFADIGTSGTYSIMGISDSLPAGTLTQDNGTNKRIKFGFYHGYAAAGNFLRVIENGVQLSDSLVGAYKKLRIIIDPDGVIYQKSRDGITWVMHRRGPAPAGGNYYPFLHLQNQNTFSAWNNVRIGRSPVGRCQYVDTTCL